MNELRGYPGAKAGPGVYQTIISHMPPHRCYVEPFVGSGAVLLHKRPAQRSVVIDADAKVCEIWSAFAFYDPDRVPGLSVVHGDSLKLLSSVLDLPELADPATLVYADPPYLRSTRRSAEPMYRHEMTAEQHELLAHLLAGLRCQVILSGYANPIYARVLKDWRRVDFGAQTRQGPAVESMWLNFEPVALHDYSYLGADFRERERIKRKRLRWRKRLAAMPALERQAIMAELLELASPPAPVLERRSAPKKGARDPLATSGEDRSTVGQL